MSKKRVSTILVITSVLILSCGKSPEERLEEIGTLATSGDVEKAINEYRGFSKEYPDDIEFIQEANELADELIYNNMINLERKCTNYAELSEYTSELIKTLDDLQTSKWKEGGEAAISNYVKEQEKAIFSTVLNYDDASILLKDVKENRIAKYCTFSEETIEDLLSFIERLKHDKALTREDLGLLEKAISALPNLSVLKEEKKKLIEREFNRWLNNRTSYIDIKPLTYTVINTKRGNRSLPFDHNEFTVISNYYFYTAERGHSYISIFCKVSSSTTNPSILDFEIYKITKSNGITNISREATMTRRYNYRKYSDYISDDIGTYNDFRYNDTVKFVWCAEVSDIDDGYYIVVLPKIKKVERATNLLELVDNYFIVAKY